MRYNHLPHLFLNLPYFVLTGILKFCPFCSHPDFINKMLEIYCASLCSVDIVKLLYYKFLLFNISIYVQEINVSVIFIIIRNIIFHSCSIIDIIYWVATRSNYMISPIIINPRNFTSWIS